MASRPPVDDDPSDSEDFDNEDFDEDTGFDEGDDDASDQSGDDEGGVDPTDGPSEQGAGGEGGSGDEVARRARGNPRVENATRIAAEAKREAEALRRELEALKGGRDTEAEAARERAYLETLDPLQRVEYAAQRSEQRMEQRFNALQANMADANDKAAFAAKCARDARLAKVADEVETALAQSRANGVTIPRETVAAYILGQKILNGAPKARKVQARAGAEAVDRSRTRAPAPAGDRTGGNRSSGGRDYLKRLEGVNI
jgi:hypothetical protein